MPDRCRDCGRFVSEPTADSKRGPTYNCRAFKIMVRPEQAVCGKSRAKAKREAEGQETLL